MRDALFILITSIVFLLWMWLTVLSWYPLLCEQRFSGVWSSIVIEDCAGSFWTPTYSGFTPSVDEVWEPPATLFDTVAFHPCEGCYD